MRPAYSIFLRGNVGKGGQGRECERRGVVIFNCRKADNDKVLIADMLVDSACVVVGFLLFRNSGLPVSDCGGNSRNDDWRRFENRMDVR